MPNQYEKLVKQQARLKQKIEREDFKLRQSKYYENRQARKARSRRLIQKGALLEKYFQADNLSVEQTEELLKIFANYVNAHKPDKIITTRKTGGLLHGYKPLRTASVSRRWLSLRSSQIAMISLPPL